MNIFREYKQTISKQGGYAILPNCIITGDGWPFEMGGKPYHRHLLAALLVKDYHGKPFRVGFRFLKKAAGLGNDSIIKALDELVGWGLLKIQKLANHPNEYDLGPFYEKYVAAFTPSPVEPAAAPKVPPRVSAPIPEDLRKLIEEDTRGSAAGG